MSISTTGPHHPSLIAQVNTRRDELKLALTRIGKDDATTRTAIETALGSLVPMLTGDLAQVPDMVSRDLTRWLELNRHLGVSQEKPVVVPEKPVVVPETPVVVAETPVVVAEKPVVISEKPVVISEKPVVISEKPVVTVIETPAAAR